NHLSAAYGRGGEALVSGRIIPDLGKKGGPFSGAGDFDFAVFRPQGNSLPGGEAVTFWKRQQGELVPKVMSDMPERVKQLEADFDYAAYENSALRGFGTTYRGRANFQGGQFVGRDQS